MDKNTYFHEKITLKLAQRYYVLSVESENFKRIQDMILTLNSESMNWPLDKTNRWLGFIQGTLFAEGLLNINTEREFSRPLFHEFYEIFGEEIPESIDLGEDDG